MPVSNSTGDNHTSRHELCGNLLDRLSLFAARLRPSTPGNPAHVWSPGQVIVVCCGFSGGSCLQLLVDTSPHFLLFDRCPLADWCGYLAAVAVVCCVLSGALWELAEVGRGLLDVTVAPVLGFFAEIIKKGGVAGELLDAG